MGFKLQRFMPFNSPDGSGILFLFSLKRKRYNGQQDKILLIAKNLMLQKTKKPIILQLSVLMKC
jgi:hypothetical protein